MNRARVAKVTVNAATHDEALVKAAEIFSAYFAGYPWHIVQEEAQAVIRTAVGDVVGWEVEFVAEAE